MATASISPKELKFGNNLRSNELDESSLRELGESMRVKQQQRIVMAPDGTIIVGNRRGKAALLVGLEFVDVEILDEMPSESRKKMYQWAENFFREGISEWDKYQTCYDLLQLNPTWKGKDLAEFLKIDPSMVTRIMSPKDTILPAREALKAGDIGISDCYALSKERDVSKQAALLDLKLKGGISRDALEAHRRKCNVRRNGSGTKRGEAKCELPDGACVVIRLKTPAPPLSLTIIAELLADALKRARKGVDEGYDVKTWEAVQRDKAKS